MTALLGPVLAATVSTGEAVTFWILAPIAVICAVGMVLARNAVHAALLLVGNFFCLAVFYALQDAPFLAAVQIIVYTGAIMILFLFVLMLVGVDSSDSLVETLRGQRVAALIAGVGFAGLLIGALASAVDGTPSTGLAAANQNGNVMGLARLLFSRYVFAFELTSALLITAAIGAMVLAHRERTVVAPSQKERSRQRFAGDHPTPLPGPGVYARHNAVDTPARLPDGTPSRLSVPPLYAGEPPPAPAGQPAMSARPVATLEADPDPDADADADLGPDTDPQASGGSVRIMTSDRPHPEAPDVP